MTFLALLAGAVGGFVAGVYASVVLVGLMLTERVPEREDDGKAWIERASFGIVPEGWTVQ